MSYLADLLGAHEPQFSHTLAQIENRHNNPSIDLKLISHLRNAHTSLLRDLKLDPKDTTAPELYQALNIRFKRDARAWLDDISPLVPKVTVTPNLEQFALSIAQKQAVELDEDLAQASTALGKLILDHDSLRFWQHHLLTGVLLKGELVSANLFDVYHNATQKLPFANRQTGFFKTSLVDELVSCYRNHKRDTIKACG
ncbi:hypothetical protein FWF48_02635 [Candidatus Saccharibacteria bacterium]|nr:hypothetical protein [Candidatus Saccharibacteria bacterium]